MLTRSGNIKWNILEVLGFEGYWYLGWHTVVYINSEVLEKKEINDRVMEKRYSSVQSS